MKSHWQLVQGNRTDSIDLVDGKVWLGTEQGFGHGSSGAVATYAEFLAGKLNEVVADTFGPAALNEVLASVSASA